MKIENILQGSVEWHAFRATHFGASEAAAMLGLSPYTSRSQLLDEKATGITREFDAATLARFADGHRTEDAARPLIEDVIGQDLYPVTCSDGDLSASCDGLTFDADLPLIAFEHKLFKASLAEAIRRNELPEEYMPQCQQIMLVTDAEHVVFCTSDGTKDNMAYMRVYPDAAWFERIVSGWAQFKKDLVLHRPQPKEDKPQAEVIMGLPALSIQVKGDVSIAGNLPRFREEADGYLKRIKTSGFQNDKDFVDAKENAKFCRGTESALELTKTNILSQTATVDEVIKVVDYYREQFRRVAIDLEKAVESEKESRKLSIIQKAKDDFRAYYEALDAEIKPITIRDALLAVNPAIDFPGATKNKRTIDSVQDAVNTELARGKISADAIAKDVRGKLGWYSETISIGAGYGFLFADLQQIIFKPFDDFRMVVQTRIKGHQDAEEVRLEKIREEERLKAEEKARAATDKVMETITGNTAQHSTVQATSAAPQPSLADHARQISGAGTTQNPRPTDDAIIAILAAHYRVHELKVIAWLMQMDLVKAGQSREVKL